MTGPTLKDTQEWLMTVLAVRGDLRQKVMAATARNGLEPQTLIKENAGPRPLRRLDIYAAGYVMRLVECLRAEFKTLAAFMGQEVFDGFAKAYIVTLPSRHRSLYALGEHFADFLAATRPHGANAPEDIAMVAIPIEIARVERARAEILLAEGFEETTDPAGTPLNSGFAFFQAGLRVETAPCLRLLKLDYPLLPLIERIETSGPHDMPPAKPAWLALCRKAYQPVTLELHSWQYEFLAAAQSEGRLRECVRVAAQASGQDGGALLADLLLWLPVAEANGLLRVLLESPSG